MKDPSRGHTERPEPPPEDRLDSWKEIAAYLRRGPRTVQRWGREQGLPVHRLGHGRQGQVFAYKSELDAWWKSRSSELEREAPAPPRPRRWLIGLAAAVVVLALGAYFFRHRIWRAVPPVEGRVVLAVLPFQNLSGDPEQEYFSDGLTEEMITQLVRVAPERLRVIARTSVMLYKRTGKKADQIARELGADYLLEGTVRREGERVRITAQLIRPAEQAHVWAESYDRALSGILAVQADVAQAVARQIRVKLAAGAGAQAAARPVDPEAFVAYLRGRQSWHRFTTEGFVQATQHFQRATELDPTYARAWLGLCDTYRMRGSWWGDLPPKEAFPLAKEAAFEALKLDPSLGEAHAGLGWIHFVFDWDWAKAEAEFRRGIELDPNSRDTHSPYANYLRCTKRLEESRVHIERSLELDPLSPLELGEAALIYSYLGQTERSAKLVQQALRLGPDFPPAIWGLAVFHAEAGRYDDAIAALEKTTRLPRPDRLSLSLLGLLYAVTGKADEARKILERMLQWPKVAQVDIARLYLRLGEKQKALEWYERGFAERDPQMVWLYWATPEFPLWDNPRFQDLLRRMNFPKPAGGG